MWNTSALPLAPACIAFPSRRQVSKSCLGIATIVDCDGKRECPFHPSEGNVHVDRAQHARAQKHKQNTRDADDKVQDIVVLLRRTPRFQQMGALVGRIFFQRWSSPTLYLLFNVKGL